jgi:beta-glucosidase
MTDWAADPEGFARALPPGFVLGTATAAFQIEGALDQGGRTPSTWDTFMRVPGAVRDGTTADVAADHYHRHVEDVALMSRLGIDAYRFSLAWPRIQPDGSGPGNPKAIAFYDRLIDELLAANIRPMATLFHWDTPLPLQEQGGWRNRDTASRFAEYAAIAGEAFGDRIEWWVTLNEPTTVTLYGYALGVHAPGEVGMYDALHAAHGQLLGHGLAVQALRAAAVTGGIGITNVHSPVVRQGGGIRSRLYAHLFDVLHNRIFADPVLLGRYPRVPPPLRGILQPLLEASKEDLATIHQPIDFYGLNYYMPTRVAAGAGDGATPDGHAAAMQGLPFHLEAFPEHETTGFGWPIASHYLTKLLRDFGKRYRKVLPPVYITEGGASFPDEVVDGSVDDASRIEYLADHIFAATAALPEVDLRGYFIWTLMDNWEWAAGFEQRFGLVHVDFETQQRTPKASYHWLRRVLEARPRE